MNFEVPTDLKIHMYIEEVTSCKFLCQGRALICLYKGIYNVHLYQCFLLKVHVNTFEISSSNDLVFLFCLDILGRGTCCTLCFSVGSKFEGFLYQCIKSWMPIYEKTIVIMAF